MAAAPPPLVVFALKGLNAFLPHLDSPLFLRAVYEFVSNVLFPVTTSLRTQHSFLFSEMARGVCPYLCFQNTGATDRLFPRLIFHKSSRHLPISLPAPVPSDFQSAMYEYG